MTDREPSPSPTVLPRSGDSPDALPHSTILESQATPSSNVTRIQAEEADHPIPEIIGTAEVHEDTRDQDPLAPLEDPRHPHRSTLSPAETVVASAIPSNNPSPASPIFAPTKLGKPLKLLPQLHSISPALDLMHPLFPYLGLFTQAHVARMGPQQVILPQIC
ncbi:hypothetical protein BC826DRAFT_997232, partial [Russula brevipes]